jgi:hypothetical protein
VLRRWRDDGITPVTDAPADGRTETAPARHLEAARAQLQLLGAPDVERDADPGPDTVAA